MKTIKEQAVMTRIAKNQARAALEQKLRELPKPQTQSARVTRERIESGESVFIGLACDCCKAECAWDKQTLLSIPAQRKLDCTVCGAVHIADADVVSDGSAW